MSLSPQIKFANNWNIYKFLPLKLYLGKVSEELGFGIDNAYAPKNVVTNGNIFSAYCTKVSFVQADVYLTNWTKDWNRDFIKLKIMIKAI